MSAHPTQLSKNPFKRFPRFHWKRWILIGAPFFLIAVLFGGPLEWILSRAMIYETPLEPVDVVLIGSLGGNLKTAAEWCKEGKTKKILITRSVPDKYRGVDLPISLYYFIKKELLETGVPLEKIDSLPQNAHNMLERQQMVQKWMRDNNCRSYLVFSGQYSSRLKKMQHDDAFPDGDVSLVIYSTNGKGVWRKEWMNIQNTLIRMAYWALVYRPAMKQNAVSGDAGSRTAVPTPLTSTE
ncbi:MAG: hypothetical protein JXR73_14600 [Candidatus Omnitrophica bacterium]|nr:hypothetical protein [Candidatus Omnitrophota bacterium]